jgi:hypothetical protein
MNLSKSRYCKGIQCPKILWLDGHKSEVRDDSIINQRILDTGNEVGDLAMGYYGDYTEVPYNADKSVMIAETRRLLDAKTSVICEASFSHDGNFCSVDILRVFDDGVEIVEVKSSTKIDPIYYDDMAFQYHVLASCGLNVRKVSIMHIDNKYERHGDLNLQQLFTVRNCTEKVLSMQDDVKANIKRLKKTADAKTEIDIEIGVQCSTPYDCVYRSYCWRHIPKNSVFDISGMQFKKQLAFYDRGIISFEQLLESGEKISKTARLQVETEVNNRPPTINKNAIKTFLDSLSWPLYLLDFEGFQEAIPPFDGLRPYMQTPFQYSLHIQKESNGHLEHREFLAEEGIDPRRSLAERICADIPQTACVIVYNKVYEKGRLKDLAGCFDDLAKHLMNIHDNIKDLMQPFQSRAYYCRELGGSYSIKQVLPTLCPNDPELDYHALDLVHNGDEAMTIYKELPDKSPEEKKRIRNALLAYCRLDTLAMVRVLEKLREIK